MGTFAPILLTNMPIYVEVFNSTRLACLSSVPVSNGLSHLEEDEDEDEQGEKFEFDDSEVCSEPLEKTDATSHVAPSSAQVTERQERNGPTCTGRDGEDPSVSQQDCPGKHLL